MIKYISIRCPNCSADLSIEEGREVAYCSYCGTRLQLYDTNEKKFTYRHIDDAEIRRADVEQQIRLKELELEEKKQATRKKFIIAWIVIILVLLALGIIGYAVDNFALGICTVMAMIVGMYGFIALFEKNNKEDDATESKAKEKKIKITRSMADFKGKNYRVVANEYLAAGFKNIVTENLEDLMLGVFAKEGIVTDVDISGLGTPEAGDTASPSARVTIEYHGFEEE